MAHSGSMSLNCSGSCSKLPEVKVEASTDRRLNHTFLSDPYKTFGSARSHCHPPPPLDPVEQQVVVSELLFYSLCIRLSKTCDHRSEVKTTKSIIKLWPNVSWFQVHIWTHLCLDMVLIMDNP